MVSAGHVLAGSPVHARVGFTFIVIDVTVWAAPARVTGTFVASMQRRGQVLLSGFYSGSLYLKSGSVLTR